MNEKRLESTLRSTTLEVPRHARFAEIGAEPGRPAELWVVLHGYGQLAHRFLRRFTALADPHRRIVAPEGLSRFYLDDRYERIGASWMTREDREDEIVDTLRWLDELAEHLLERDGAPTRTVLLGFSQGAPAAGRWLVRGRARIDRLICWGAGLPQDVDLTEHSVQYTNADLTLVIGDEDPLISNEMADAEIGRLHAAGIAHTVRHYAGGHDIDTDTLVDLARR